MHDLASHNKFSVCVVLALFASLGVNLVSICIHIATNANNRAYGSYTSTLPIQIRRAALVTNGSAKRYGLNADQDWISLTPPGHGFFVKDQQYFGVSMYHQIHCLNALRRIIVADHQNQSTKYNAHAHHCLAYLREMILCNADTTLEPSKAVLLSDGRTSRPVTGWRVTHECRDWVQVRDFVQENYLEWKDSDEFADATDVPISGRGLNLMYHWEMDGRVDE
ncbi:hypothetical protein BJ138DRAFT_1117176 [Hygrophoropsis aurantiaca]|uniref:Uncharacterized protein n=1 Tax=Hygrophoropsis aurantiaca TaxID=72124 RepID=A0ACB8A034_9AGAM|nr:hypothetical protein BJ138DRAFT_1117176 [Hygrophoropsis aurantiaca]